MMDAPPHRWTAVAALAMTGVLAGYLLAAERLASLTGAYGWFRQFAGLIFAGGG
jgi:hypothetical protein